MTRRRQLLASLVSGAVIVAFAAADPATALTCVRYPDVLQAAVEALAADDPDRGHAYIVGRVEAIERVPDEPVQLVVTPTHVFSGEPPARVRLAARMDGPPSPQSWVIDGLYFLAISEAAELEGVAGLVSPCAPNFRVTSAEQLERLVAAAPEVEVRDREASVAGEPDLGPALGVGVGIGVIGLASALSFNRGRRRPRTS